MNQKKMMIAILAMVMSFAVLANAEEVPYTFSASVSNGITIFGQVMVETTNPGCEPGGTVEFNSGGITGFFFEATDGSLTETIDSSLFVPTPQTMLLTFSTANFPEIEAWDFSFSNEFNGGVLHQMVTVQSPANPGFEQWSGDQLGGSSFPSNGVWTAPSDVVSNQEESLGGLKALFR